MYIMSILRGVEQREIDTWCAQFGFMFAKFQYKVVYPPINLIENIGFSDQVTHTNDPNSKNNVSHMKLDFKNLKESYDKSFDHEGFNIEHPNIFIRVIKKCKKFLKII